MCQRVRKCQKVFCDTLGKVSETPCQKPPSKEGKGVFLTKDGFAPTPCHKFNRLSDSQNSKPLNFLSGRKRGNRKRNITPTVKVKL